VGSGLQIDVIDRLSDLEAHRDNWKWVHAHDPTALVQHQWFWQHNWASQCEGSWCVLAARRGDEYVAYLPLVVEGMTRPARRVQLGGSPLGVSTAFLCTATEDRRAVIRRMMQLIWRRLGVSVIKCHDVTGSDINLFGRPLLPLSRRVDWSTGLAVSRIPLPGSWEDYRMQHLGTTSRVSLKRKMKGLAHARHVEANPENLHAFTDVLLSLWQERWGSQPESYLKEIRSLFARAYEEGYLKLDVLFDDDTPIAAQAGFLDEKNGTYHCFLAPYALSHSRQSPGRVIMGLTIRWAIDSGFRTFSFGRGGEVYKDSFGAESVSQYDISIRRRSFGANRIRNLLIGRSLDERGFVVD